LALAGLGTAGFTECLEHPHRILIFRRLPFRVPLHREQEGRQARCVDRFHQAVFGTGQGLDAFAEVFQALAVQRVDADFIGLQQFIEPAARLDAHAVHGAVLHVHRIVRVSR